MPPLNTASHRARQYVQINKDNGNDWFTIESNKEGTRWHGKCWHFHNRLRHEFAFEFDLPATYPAAAPEIKIPELEGKTAKMYRGGKICLTVHFNPLWSKNVPHFGIAHALALGVRARPPRIARGRGAGASARGWLLRAHALLPSALFPQLGPWLAAEVPDLVENGFISTNM